jgi:hypothetical protein
MSQTLKLLRNKQRKPGKFNSYYRKYFEVSVHLSVLPHMLCATDSGNINTFHLILKHETQRNPDINVQSFSKNLKVILI